jgi:hypothetical protein
METPLPASISWTASSSERSSRCSSSAVNALQRGFWTHTKNGIKYFDSVTNGWIDYSHNLVLVKLFSHALLATSKGYETALVKLQEDIDEQKQRSNLK